MASLTTSAGHPLRPALGMAQSAVSIIAAGALLALGVALLRGAPVARGAAYVWPERAVTIAGIAYLSSACLIHARWGNILRQGRSVGSAVAACASSGHLAVGAAVVYALSRESRSRLLLAELASPSSAWLTLACIGAIVSLGGLWLGVKESRDSALTPRPLLAGFKHALPPLLIAVVLAVSIVWLESLPLPAQDELSQAVPQGNG